MVTKTLNLQTYISITKDNVEYNIAFLTAQISSSNFSISTQTLSETLALENEELMQKEYLKFEQEVKEEAVAYGLKIFKKEE